MVHLAARIYFIVLFLWLRYDSGKMKMTPEALSDDWLLTTNDIITLLSRL